MLEHYWRNGYQKWCVDPIVNLLAKSKKISANKITLTAAITGVFAGISLALHWSAVAFILLLLSGWLDTLDGSFARKTQSSSHRGSVLDIVCDRLVEFFIVFGLFLYAPETRALAAICLLGSFLLCISSFLVVAIFSENQGERSFYYSPGLIERTEAFVFFALMILLPSLFNLLAWLLILLVMITTVTRVLEFYRQQGALHEHH
jgi:phosphatidylglycerophosphate synthase